MRIKTRYLFLVLFLALIAFTCAQAAVNPSGKRPDIATVINPYNAEKAETAIEESFPSAIARNKQSFHLPASLQIIDESAFEGTALVAVDLPVGVTYIGDRAFANIPTLLGVKIPDNTQYIGKDAFNNSKQVILTTSANSYARDWAKKNGLPFQLLVTFNASNGITQSTIQPNRNAHPSQKESADTTEKTNTNNRERRTGRSVGELKASQNKGVAALYIQSRYFP